MINSGNSNLDFSLNKPNRNNSIFLVTAGVGAVQVKSSSAMIMPTDKLNSTAHLTSHQIPQARFYTKKPYFNTIAQQSTTTLVNALQKEKVRVQLLQTHSKLQNNRWDYQHFSGFNKDDASEAMECKEAANSNSSLPQLIMSKLNTNNKSAFYEERESNNNNNNLLKTAVQQQQQQPLAKVQSTSIYDKSLQQQQHRRTEDQENAFRRIEDVHNYAKLNYSHYNGSSESFVDDPEDDYEDDDIEEDEEEEDIVNGDINYESYFKSQKNSSNHNLNTHVPHKIINSNIDNAAQRPDDSEQQNVDVESLQNDEDDEEEMADLGKSTVTSKDQLAPDHHARRPMNAFLIFCKRHRAIVKDRYKSLENR